MLQRITFLSTNMTLEGNVVFHLAQELAKKGFNVSLVCPHSAKTRKSEKISGVQLERFVYFLPTCFETLAQGEGMFQNIRRNKLNIFLIPFFMASFSAKAFFSARKSDLIHAHWLPAGIAALPAKFFFRKPLVVTLHGSDIRNQPKPIINFFLRRFDAVITGHDELLEIAKGIVPEKTFLVRNLIDFDAFEKMSEQKKARQKLGFSDSKVVSFIGRLDEFKQPLELLHAAVLVLKKFSSVKFVFVGDGPMKSSAESLAKELGIEKSVFFAGRVNNVFDYLAASDIFASISHIENAFSVSLIEALLSSVPCVLTKAGTTENFFSDKKNCLLVEKNDRRQLADAILFLLNEQGIASQIGKRGRQLALEIGFDKEKIIGKTLSIYSDLLNKKAFSLKRNLAKPRALRGHAKAKLLDGTLEKEPFANAKELINITLDYNKK